MLIISGLEAIRRDLLVRNLISKSNFLMQVMLLMLIPFLPSGL
jgi:hypothetical protein